VKPYYAELQKIMHVADRSSDPESATFPRTEQPTDSPDIHIHFSKWAPFSKRNLAQTIGNECLHSSRITVFLHANVTSIEASKVERRVEHVLAKNYNGQIYEFRARYFVICVGTIESCRLLLASTSAFECGVGNRTDQVGRFFHDHISVAAATVTGRTRREFGRFPNPRLVPTP
jgi:choline dehydrogenase-like flavoprotein